MLSLMQLHGKELYSDAGIDNLVLEYVYSLKQQMPLPETDTWLVEVVNSINELAKIIEYKCNECINVAFDLLIVKRIYLRHNCIYIEMIGRD